MCGTQEATGNIPYGFPLALLMSGAKLGWGRGVAREKLQRGGQQEDRGPVPDRGI